MRDACEDGARARDARGEGRGELAWGGEGRGPKRTAVKHPPPPHVRPGIQMARLTVMARFSNFSGRKNAKGGVKPQVAKIEAASRGHKPCHNGHPCHSSAITVALAILRPRPSPLPSGRNSHPPCRCDDANARTKKQQELSERGYFAIPAPSISDGELLQGEAPPCHSANALHRSFETQQGNRATKKAGAGYVPTPAFGVAVRAGCLRARTNEHLRDYSAASVSPT